MSLVTHGKIVWWSDVKQHGTISADVGGKNQRFYLHISRIASGPESIHANQLVYFTPSEKEPTKPGRLPIALNVVIQDEAFEDEVAKTMNQDVSQDEGRDGGPGLKGGKDGVS